MAKKGKRHHSNKQERSPSSKRFVSAYSNDKLYFVLREVCTATNRFEPAAVTQDAFDEHSADVMATLEMPPPPSARAIYQRLNKGRQTKRSWRQLIETALASKSDVHTAAKATAAEAKPEADERHLFYSLRRTAAYLGYTPTEIQHDRAVTELLRKDADLDRGGVLAEILLTSDQMLALVDGGGWPAVCAFVGLEPPARQVVRGFSPVKMLAHFYYAKPGLPHSYEELRKHAASFDIPLPADGRLPAIRAEFIADRAARGLATPREGPPPGDTLTAAELETLLEGAPRVHRKGYWTLERTLTALAEYIDEFESSVPLRQRHYGGVAKGRDWPTKKMITDRGKESGIGGFQAMLEEARKRRPLKRAA